MFARTALQETCTLDATHAPTRDVVEPQNYHALRNALVRAVRCVCPRSLAEEAEDLVQESFIRLFRAHRADLQAQPSSAYLKKVAYSAVIDEIRRRRRRPAGDESQTRIEIDAVADELPATDADASLGEAIEVSLQRLQPDRRRALTLHLLGYSGSEVAHMLGCNSKRADNLTHRGLVQLREHLHEMGVSP